MPITCYFDPAVIDEGQKLTQFETEVLKVQTN